jgi:sugar lactone lactonase YvrE
MRRIEPKIELALDVKNHLGETPVWSQAEQALYWVNCEEPAELLRWAPGSAEVRRWPMPARIGGFVLKQGGGALVVLADGLYDMDFGTGRLGLRVPSPFDGGISLHECICDPSGRFWVGSINDAVNPDNLHPGGGKLFRLDGDELVPVIEDISCSNGLAFSPDGRTLYHTDAPTGRCYKWDCDPATGEIGNQRLLLELAPGEGFVDGATVDAEGGYWATIVYSGYLRRYLPDGSYDLEVKLPFVNPTKVVFGGSDLDTLYITSMAQGAPGEVEPGLDGGLYAFKPGVKGRPDIMFAG